MKHAPLPPVAVDWTPGKFRVFCETMIQQAGVDRLYRFQLGSGAYKTREAALAAIKADAEHFKMTNTSLSWLIGEGYTGPRRYRVFETSGYTEITDTF